MAKRTCSIDGCEGAHYGRGWCRSHYDRLWQSSTPCAVAECDRSARSRGWCTMHYRRWQKHGDPEWTPPQSVPATCSVPGCDRTVRSRGWCQRHYSRWIVYGDAQYPTQRYERLPASATTEERWLFHVDKNGPPAKNCPDLGCCWLWTARTNKGYGQFRDEEGATVAAHRWAYEHFVGPLPPDRQFLDHFACDNPPCCNPAHVVPVTHAENTARGTAGKPGNAGKTHCKRGHPFDEANTHVRYLKDGRKRRECRACAAERRDRRECRVTLRSDYEEVGAA